MIPLGFPIKGELRVKMGAHDEVDLIAHMDDVSKAAKNSNSEECARIFAHDLRQLQIQILQGMDPNAADFQEECKKAVPLSDRLRDMIATDILTCKSKKEMIRVEEFYTNVAHEAFIAQDYQSAVLVKAPLSSWAVSRLCNPQELSNQAQQRLSEIAQHASKFSPEDRNNPNRIPSIAAVAGKVVQTKEMINNIGNQEDAEDIRKECLQGIEDTKQLLFDLANNLEPEPMQSNLEEKICAPTLKVGLDPLSDNQDPLSHPNSLEHRSAKLKKLGVDTKIHFHSRAALKSTHDIKKELENQQPITMHTIIPDRVARKPKQEVHDNENHENADPRSKTEKIMDLKHRLKAAQERKSTALRGTQAVVEPISNPPQAVTQQANRESLKKMSTKWRTNFHETSQQQASQISNTSRPTAESVAKGMDPIIQDALQAHQQYMDSKKATTVEQQAPLSQTQPEQPQLKSALRATTNADNRSQPRRVTFQSAAQESSSQAATANESKPAMLNAFSNFSKRDAQPKHDVDVTAKVENAPKTPRQSH